MKLSFVLIAVVLCAILFAGYSKAQPAGGEEVAHHRQKRATCDLLAPTGYKETLCAAHCIVLGYRGGWCDSKAVCNCRK
ncbi:lucifensin-like [Teleopsis dalmanni]|uniref:lucifensin-like n=1 Tax=Teleopsis dalmanni TaxID=139649 RepID=UPI0018CE230C|nr:lucifensin-like [Teleopsis dalmanni]